MKLIKFLTIIVVSLGFFNLASSEQVVAQTFPDPAWKLVSACGPGQIHPKDFDYITKINFEPDLNKDEFINALTGGTPFYCGEGSNFEINGWNISVGTARYCGPGWVTTRNKNGEQVRSVTSGPLCCPFTHPNSDALNIDTCCEPGYWPKKTVDQCDGGTRAESVNASTDTFASPAGPIVASSGALYECPLDGCLTDAANNPVDNRTNITPLSQNTVNGLKCFARSVLGGADDDGDGIGDGEVIKPGGDPANPLHCQAGEWVTEDELTIDNAIVISSCAAIRDEAERDRCLACFAKNPDSGSGEPQTYVYSSLGCIDTRQNPFITRLFQTGFGLLGGFAIIMIMWGAILRQSTDPAKIQEGSDKIKAAIASIVMIASAIPLLRFIGINLTGLLPFNIFN
ncbi:hypothetical protein KC675_02030 [Candidatus Dojkabacteria bacterium]|uniref:Uncharacterized protein n=1 Tax=Candidatus Dojkabacteria bacterium TaxID=2099670 RepID=A0A955KZJ5_9BACT|nr:hypothetical protein [Candidatus Dojkabacteria bacterium]